MKLGARVDIGCFKSREQDFDPLTLLRRQAFGARFGFGFGFGLTDHGGDHALAISSRQSRLRPSLKTDDDRQAVKTRMRQGFIGH